MRRDEAASCRTGTPPALVESLVISSSNGVSYLVTATPALSFPEGPGTDQTVLTWSGLPEFSVSKFDLRWSYDWHFKVVAAGQAEISYNYRSLTNGVVDCDVWKGTVTRSD